MTTLLILGASIGGWLLCGVVAYMLMRIDHIRRFGKWTVGYRRACIMFALAGPLTFLIVTSILWNLLVNSYCNDDEAASW